MSQFSANSQLKSGKKLLQAAQKAEGEQADSLYQQACSKFELVVNSGAKVLEGLHNWGLTLYSQAKSHDGQDAENFFNEAYAKYSAAMVIEPRNYEILNDWGATMMDQARMLNANPSHVLYEQAKQKLETANELYPGIAAYNLACIDSIQNDLQSCQEHLTTALERSNLPPIEDIKNDVDLANINQSEWFQEFLDSIPSYS